MHIVSDTTEIDSQRPSWETLLVVCRECQKRSSGPKSLKAKEVIREARQAIRAVKPRPRVVSTSCLGVCPKRAIAVATVGGANGPRIVEVADAKEMASAITRLAPG